MIFIDRFFDCTACSVQFFYLIGNEQFHIK